MMKKHGPWQILRTEKVYEDPWIRLTKDDVIRPDGQPGTYSVVNLKPGVSVLALDEEKNVHLTEEFHYGVGRVTIEAVSGGLEPNERPLETAERELAEELGIRAKRWTHLGFCDPFTGSVVSPTQLYLAEGLTLGVDDPEGTEQIRRVCLPLEAALKKVERSEITHTPSCILILRVALLLGSAVHS